VEGLFGWAGLSLCGARLQQQPLTPQRRANPTLPFHPSNANNEMRLIGFHFSLPRAFGRLGWAPFTNPNQFAFSFHSIYHSMKERAAQVDLICSFHFNCCFLFISLVDRLRLSSLWASCLGAGPPAITNPKTSHQQPKRKKTSPRSAS